VPETSRPAVRVNPLEDPAWDARLAHAPQASFFHGLAWARVLHGSYGFAPCYWVDRGTEGPLRAVLPLMEVDSPFTGRRGISLPFTDECEPLAPNSESFHPMFEAAVAHARDRAWKYLELRGGKQHFPHEKASTSYYGHRLGLCGDDGKQFDSIEPSVRRAVRKAEHSGIAIEVTQSSEAVRTFYRLVCRTRRRQGVPPQPFTFYSKIHEHVLAPGHGRIVLARHRGIPVAGAMYFHSGKAAVYKFGASDERFQHLRANNLVTWEAIKRYSAEGFGTLDFGRTSLSNAGLRKFKLGWGTRETSIDYLRFNLRASRFVDAPDAASGVHTPFFRFLPSPLSRLIGMALYKHIA
jgi:hypothetical protein